MTTEPMLDRRLRELMADLAAPGDTSTAIDHVLSVTRPMRPEPRWRAMLKERPMRTSSVLVAGSPPLRTGLILAVIAILVAVAATIAVGAFVLRPAPLPPAYGPAGNGDLAMAVGGDIALVDAAGTQTTITSGLDFDRQPVFSRDGTKVAFIRQEPQGSIVRVMAMNLDGTGLVEVSPGMMEVQAIDWSPTGDRIAVLGDVEVNPRPSLYVFDAAGGGVATPIEIGDLAMADWLAWRPPTGDELLVRAHPMITDPAVGLYAVDPDGGPVRTLLEPAEAASEGDSVVDQLAVSPDGQWVTFWTWGPNEGGEVNGWGHVLNLDSGDERIATTWGGSPSPITPDGRSVVGAGSGTLVLEPLDGSAPSVPFGPELDMGGIDLAISPDGTAILATESSGERTLIDIATGTTTPLEAPMAGSFSWQRIALP